MQYTINELNNILHKKVNGIYDIFKGFFGESHVDLQLKKELWETNSSIEYFLRTNGLVIPEEERNDWETKHEVSDELLDRLKAASESTKVTVYVWFPFLTVTNENDKSVNIQDLYAKVDIQLDGRIPYENTGFLLNRATYTEEQFISDYMFSHIRNIPKDDFTKFMQPCLGHGPIRGTIATLKNDSDDVTWMLFCQELSMYVTVESLVGGPWKRMENIGRTLRSGLYYGYDFKTCDTYSFTRVFSTDQLREFIKYYLQNGHLSISYIDGRYTCGMPYYDYIIDISNAFIDYYNKYLKAGPHRIEYCFIQGLLNNVRVIDGKFYTISTDSATVSNIDTYQNKLVLRFKGKDILTKIVKESKSEAVNTIVLSQKVAMYILRNIIRTINFRYKNEHNNKTRNQGPSTACERVCYI